MILSFNFSKQVTEYVANIFEEKLKFDNSNVNVSRTSFCMKINDNFISVGKIQICHNLFFLPHYDWSFFWFYSYCQRVCFSALLFLISFYSCLLPLCSAEFFVFLSLHNSHLTIYLLLAKISLLLLCLN